MASRAPAGPTKADLEETLDKISAKADEGLDPELTREEVVAVLKEISSLADDDDDEEEDDEEDDDEDGQQ